MAVLLSALFFIGLLEYALWRWLPLPDPYEQAKWLVLQEPFSSGQEERRR